MKIICIPVITLLGTLSQAIFATTNVNSQEIKEEFIWPTNGVVSSEWGERYGEFHDGIDIICRRGKEIKAAKAGVIKRAKKERRLGYHAIIDHLDGYQTVYGHGSKLIVAKGDKVIQGQPVILCGSTGLSTGSHLHLEVIENGEKIDPRKIFKGNPLMGTRKSFLVYPVLEEY